MLKAYKCIRILSLLSKKEGIKDCQITEKEKSPGHSFLIPITLCIKSSNSKNDSENDPKSTLKKEKVIVKEENN